MKDRKLFFVAAALLLSFSAQSTVFAQAQFSVYAAASLTGPLKEIIPVFEKKTGAAVKLNLASSGNLARQIEQGAPADVYISASQKWMDYAQDNGTIDPATRIDPVGNTVVLVSPAGSKPVEVRFEKGFSLAQAFEGKFSIGDPSHVPAGKYARQAMEALGWWQDLAPRLILAKDVRQALMVVEAGEVELGTVFGSDAKTSDKVQLAGVFPEGLHDPVVYSAALCSGGSGEQAKELGGMFLNFLTQDEAQRVFVNYGFVPVR